MENEMFGVGGLRGSAFWLTSLLCNTICSQKCGDISEELKKELLKNATNLKLQPSGARAMPAMNLHTSDSEGFSSWMNSHLSENQADLRNGMQHGTQMQLKL